MFNKIINNRESLNNDYYNDPPQAGAESVVGGAEEDFGFLKVLVSWTAATNVLTASSCPSNLSASDIIYF